MERDQYRLQRIQARDRASAILSEKLHGAETCLIAVRAGVLRGDYTRDGGVPAAGCARCAGSMMRRARAGHRRVTPTTTQQRSVWPDYQYQHD